MIIKNKLAQVLQDILNENPGDNLLFNPYFRIPRNNNECLSKYKLLESKNKNIINILLKLPIIFMNFALNSFGSLVFAKQYNYFVIKSTPSKLLFISHATNNNLSGTSDVYFSNLPTEIGGNKSTIIYLNNYRRNYTAVLEKLRAKNNGGNILLMPKFLHPKELPMYFKYCWNQILTEYRIYQKYKQHHKLKSLLMIESMYWTFSRESHNNFLLIRRLHEIESKIELKKLFLTLEGHSYEELSARKFINMDRDKLLVFTQHSPISKDQSGVTNFLRNFGHQIIVLTTGPAYSEYLATQSKLVRTFCIGSIKTNRLQKRTNLGFRSILVAPEGTSEATKELLRVMETFSGKYPELQFIMRVHPNLRKDCALKFMIYKMSRKKNVEISNQDLLTDLDRSQATLYVGSTVAVQALSSFNLPIFVDLQDNKNLNILSLLKEELPSIEHSGIDKEPLEFLKGFNLASINFGEVERLYVPLKISNSLKSILSG